MKLIAIIILLFVNIQNCFAQDTHSEHADKASFHEYLASIKQKALDNNVSATTLDEILPTIKYLPKVVKFDRRQNEFTTLFEDYQKNQITASRIKKAANFLKKYKEKFDNIEQEYGVPRQMIVALWAIESNFGKNMGRYHVPSSLATLAYDGRRRALFEDQLIKAFKIIDQKHISSKNMRGSWAGAMGQSQFMPSSFLNYAVDYSQDGTKDIWRSKQDVWASIANYLKTEGWDKNSPKTIKVTLPKGYKYTEAQEKEFKKLSDYRLAGVTLLENIGGDPMVRLIKPDRSRDHQAFIIFKNFDVILHWNRSYFFALTVSKLADQIKAYTLKNM